MPKENLRKSMKNEDYKQLDKILDYQDNISKHVNNLKGKTICIELTEKLEN